MDIDLVPACHLPPTPGNNNTMFIVKLAAVSIVVLVLFNIALGWLLYKVGLCFVAPCSFVP
jgi:hypothetical protein